MCGGGVAWGSMKEVMEENKGRGWYTWGESTGLEAYPKRQYWNLAVKSESELTRLRVLQEAGHREEGGGGREG